MAEPSKIDAPVCERLVDRALATCTARPPLEHTGTAPADALVAFADAIALATFGLALLVAIGTLGWLFYVRHRTKMEAKAEVQKVAPEQIKAYLEVHVPEMVAEMFAALSAGSGKDSGPGLTAEEQAKELGEDPG